MIINLDRILINSPIEISGLNDDKPYIELTTRLCWLDYPNLNGVGLSSNAEDSFKTLIGMPVVAKINKAGTRFGGHEVSIDDNNQIKFNTSAYGVHTEVWVAEDEVEIPKKGLVTAPCLFAKSRIWKRFSSVVDLISKKFENPDEYNGGLWSSWEIQGGEYHLDDDNKKIYDSFTFLSNCLIDVPPAYSSASKTLAIASAEFEDELCNAYLNDLDKNNINISKKEDNDLRKHINISALTLRDLHEKISKALNPKGWSSNPFYSIWEVYAEDHKIIAYDIDRESSDDYYVISYTVNGDEVEIGDKTVTKLSKLIAEKTNVNISVNLDDTAKLLSEKEVQISQLSEKLTEVSTELEEKTNALVEAGEKIAKLKQEVEDLKPFKEQVEKAEAEKQQAEIAAKKEQLKELATKGGYITKEEVESSEEISSMIDNLDEKGIKALIAERVLQKLNEEKPNEIDLSFESASTEVKANINADDGIFDAKKIMSSFLNN